MTRPDIGLGLDFHWLAGHLAVGGRFPSAAAAILMREHGIDGVVDCRIEDRDDEAHLARHGIELLHLPGIDGTGLGLELLDHGIRWVGERTRRGRRTLIHCQHGIGRSALLACCVLVSEEREPLEALAIAKAARPVISPSPQQLEGYREWLTRWRDTHGAGWPVPPFESLARLVWRDLGEGVEGTGRPLDLGR